MIYLFTPINSDKYNSIINSKINPRLKKEQRDEAILEITGIIANNLPELLKQITLCATVNHKADSIAWDFENNPYAMLIITTVCNDKDNYIVGLTLPDGFLIIGDQTKERKVAYPYNLGIPPQMNIMGQLSVAAFDSIDYKERNEFPKTINQFFDFIRDLYDMTERIEISSWQLGGLKQAYDAGQRLIKLYKGVI